MKVLLDAHALLWFLAGSDQLSAKALACIQDTTNTIFVSAATLWELGIKDALGKLTLAKYADDAVNHLGEISNGSWNWFGPIIHGRRAELEYLAKNADAKPGTHVTFEVVKSGTLAKIVSDVDAFKGGAAISIKRQGKTLDEWARPGNKRDEWLAAYMTKIKEGLTVDGKVVLPSSNKMVFFTGKELPSEATQKRLKEIGEKIFGKNNVVFDVLPILPPPAIN